MITVGILHTLEHMRLELANERALLLLVRGRNVGHRLDDLDLRLRVDLHALRRVGAGAWRVALQR